MFCSLIDVFMAPFTQRQKGFTKLSVIQMAKKLTAPKTKTKVVTRYKDKPKQKKQKVIKPGTPPETAIDQPITSFDAVKPVAPVPPLSNQQAPD